MGIEAAHNNHIIHRDIKPQNIMISKEGKVKVTDFGIAKAVTSNTITSNVMGSVHYTSPEQARGGYSDEKSDIYSLGITMFEMLTGRVPFNGETTVAIAIKHIQEPMPSPREYIPEIPISVEQIVFKCTQKSPDRRYQSMPEVVADLKQSLMHPDEDFVKMVDPDEEAATRMISEQDMRRIKQESKKRDSMDEAIRVRTGEEPKKTVKKKTPKNIDERPRAARTEIIEEEEDDDDSGMDKITTILAVIAAILFCAVIILLAGKKMGLFGFGETVTEETTIEESIVTTQTIPQTTVADEELDENTVKVPDVTNMSYAEAVANLNKKGFKVVKEESESGTVKKGNVISQVPAAGENAKLGTSVTVYVSISSSVGKVSVPNLIGLSEEDAIVVLVESGLDVGVVSQTTNADPSLVNLVCYQSYSENVEVEEGTKVDIKISIGTGNSTYSFVGNIESPSAEDGQYVPGTDTIVILTTSTGVEIKRETTQTFPVSFNVSGITGAEDGFIYLIYNVTIPGSSTTNENGEVVTTPETVEERTVRRSVKFAKE